MSGTTANEIVPQEVVLFGPWPNLDTEVEHPAGDLIITHVFFGHGSVNTTPEISAGDTEAPSDTLDLGLDALKSMARQTPHGLIRLIGQGGLKPPDLTFAAEAAGEISDSGLAVAALLPLLEHGSPLVREGATYGLARHLSSLDVVSRLQQLVTDDSSPGVRQAIKETLEDS